jgi:hypothetical protein
MPNISIQWNNPLVLAGETCSALGGPITITLCPADLVAVDENVL